MLESPLNKVTVLQDLLKRDSNTDFFQWNLWNFQVHCEHSSGCFQQMFTLQQNNMIPKAILKNFS